jgi:acetoin utilization protein AcuB
MEEKQLVGIVSDRDLAYALSPFLDTPDSQSRDLALLQKKAHQIMTRDVITISRKTSIEDACRLILQNDISCLPVVTSEGEVDGIITWRDLFRALLKLDRI